MEEKKKWKPVTIGGFTGILMGAGTMYFYQTSASSEANAEAPVERKLVEVTEPGEDLSFAKAFEAARAELGPGGVFRWHGNVYNTYTAEEWDAMPQHQKHQFAARIEPEVSVDEIDTQQMTYVAKHDEVEVATPLPQTVDAVSEVKEEDVTVAQNTQPDNDDVDVRIVGEEQLMAPNGQYIGVQEVELNGRRVTVIDVDNDGYGDYAMSDLNHNGIPEEGEVIDLHTGRPVAFDNEASAPEEDVAMAGESDNGFVATDDTSVQDDGSDGLTYSL